MTKQNITIAITVVVLTVVILLIFYYCLLLQRSLTRLTPRNGNGNGTPSPPITNGSDPGIRPIRERNGNGYGQGFAPGHDPVRERGDVQLGPVRERPEPAHLERGP